MAACDMSMFLKFSYSELISHFIHNCIDDFVGRKSGSYENYNNDIEWTKDDCEKARNLIINLFKVCALGQEDLDNKLQDLPGNVQIIIKGCYDIRRDHILQAVLKENLMKTGQPLVGNIDWKLKWILGSSTLVTISEPVLQVDLHYLKKTDTYSKSFVNFEMNLEQLNAMIGELERVKTELETKCLNMDKMNM